MKRTRKQSASKRTFFPPVIVRCFTVTCPPLLMVKKRPPNFRSRVVLPCPTMVMLLFSNVISLDQVYALASSTTVDPSVASDAHLAASLPGQRTGGSFVHVSTAANQPAVQSAHATTVDLALTRPAAHEVHDEAAMAPCHLPAGHAAQAPAPGSALNWPAAQSAHVALAALVCATGPWRPAAHGVPVHGWYPLLECVPATQGLV